MTQETAQLLAALTRQEELLKKLIVAIDKPKLGFHNDAGTVFVYCNRSKNCLWYTLTNGEPTPINHTALTGYLRQLKFEKVERRGKEVYKLLTTIQADKLYSLESGFDSHFSRCLLMALATLSPQHLQGPITIQPVAGDDESVLFCRVWIGSELVKAPYDQDIDWRQISKTALAHVKAANEF